MGKLRIMSRIGDRQIAWDEQKAEMGDTDALAAVREAERIFEEERKKGSAAFRIRSGRPAQLMNGFDETEDQIVIVPRVAGG
jgi:hypothetical protein